MKNTNIIENADSSNHLDTPNCNHCRHFYITWNVKMPYGCRAMNFKSRRIPAVEVFDADGSPCVSFIKRRKMENLNEKDASKKSLGKYLSIKA